MGNEQAETTVRNQENITIDQQNTQQTEPEKKGQESKESGGAAQQEEKTYTIKVDGRAVTVTETELLNLASKAAGADKRLEEAAQMRKAAARGMRVQELFSAITENPDEVPDSDVEELAGLLGADPDELKAAISGSDRQDDSGYEEIEKEVAGGRKRERTGRPISFEDLSPQLQQIITEMEKNRLNSVYEDVKQQVRRAVDSDEILGKMIRNVSEESAEAIREAVFNDVQRRILYAGKMGTETIGDSIKSMRTQFMKFGIPTERKRQPVPSGLPPFDTLPQDAYSKEIGREPASSDRYVSNFVARFLQRRLKDRNEA